MRKLICTILSVSMILSAVNCFGVTVSAAPKNADSTAEVIHMQTDRLNEPMGIDSENPVFSWQISDSTARGQKQTSYRITVAESENGLESGNYVWDSGIVNSDNTLEISYEGEQLKASTRYFWQVEITDKDGNTAVSDTAWFETGLMDSGWDGAKWLGRSAVKSKTFSELTSFTIDYDYTIKKNADPVANAASVLFGATDKTNFYMWQVSAFSWHTQLLIRPHKFSSGSWGGAPDQFALEKDQSNVGTEQHLKIEVNDGVITTYFNNSETPSNTATVDSFALGYVGFRASGSEEYYIDNFKITDGNGKVILDEDFDDDNIQDFPETAHKNGRLEITKASLGNNEIFLRTTDGSETKAESSPMFRKEFSTDQSKDVKSARLYITSAGLYDAYINGKRVTDSVLNPGMTAYDDHILYQTYDVTDLVNDGENVIGAYLGHGWFDKALRNFGSKLLLYAKLLITYTDGSTDVVVTDDSWKFYRYGPILDDDIFNGFKFDGQTAKSLDGWNNIGFDDSDWDKPALYNANQVVYQNKTPEIIAQNLPLIKNTIKLKALAVTEPEDGVYIYDFGQNIAGVVRVTATADAGTVMKLRHAEILNRENMKDTSGNSTGKPGTLYTGNLPRADATDTYTFYGDPNGETFEPFFTYHGFRYLEITGLDEAPALEDVTALLIMSDLEQTSTFTTSDESVNRLYQNALWSAHDNFMSVPTDCPQRGERFGWTGDAQIFARTATYMMDVNAFYQKYCMDMRDTSTDNRIIADVSPASFGNGWYGSGDRKGATNGWGDAIIIIPYQMYMQYGNKQILTENYQTMKNWMDYLVSTSTDYIRDESWTGDWLPVGEAKSPIGLTDTAFCAYSAQLLSEIAGILGNSEDVETYNELYNNYRNAWRAKYLDDDGASTLCGTQTSYVLGIKFGLFDEDKIPEAAQNLVNNIKNRGWHLSTGFLGLSYLNPILSDTGYSSVAYKLLEQKEYPSWLYSVTTGSTTIWESWYALRVYDDGSSIANGESFNHFSYGAVAEWMFRYMLGIERDESSVAYKRFVLKPEFGGSITSASGSYNSVRGKIESAWTLDKDSGDFTYNAAVPANTTATLYLPVLNNNTAVYESSVNAEDADGVTFTGFKNGFAVYELESGSYSFKTVVNPNMYEATTVKLANPQEVPATVTVDGKEYTAFPKTVSVTKPSAKISAVPNESCYVFLGFADNNGNIIDTSNGVSGDIELYLKFAYTGNGDTTDTRKTIKIDGTADTVISVNGEEFTLPYSGTFDKDSLVTVKAVSVKDGYELSSIGNMKAFNGAYYFMPKEDITLSANVVAERYRQGYDIFFDFEDSVENWQGMSAALSHMPSYMRFLSVAKDDGSYDPRAHYNFTAADSITDGKSVKASDYDKIVISYIADKVDADSTPVMYIATEAQPSYINPVRALKATSAVTTDMADGKTLRTIEFNVGSWSGWTGNITQIYLDIVDNVFADLRVDYIKLKHRDVKLTVVSNNFQGDKVYTYLPGAVADLSEIPSAAGLLGYTLENGSEDYITTVTLTDDTTVYADYGKAETALVWNFDDKTSQGWTANNVASVSYDNGTLRIVPSDTKNDIMLVRMGLSADASLYKYVVFDMRHNLPDSMFGSKKLEVFFRRTTDGWVQNLQREIKQNSVSDEYSTYVLNMGSNSNWNGTISHIRIDPFETTVSGSNYYIELDNIKLVPEAKLTLSDGYDTANDKVYGAPAYTDVDLSQHDVPERNGYKFAGWTDKNGNALETVKLYANTTVYASWDEINTVVWDFDDNTTQSWAAINSASDEVKDGAYKSVFMTSNADMWYNFISCNVDAAKYRYVVFRLRHNIPDSAIGSKKAEVYFTRTTDSPWQAHLMASTSQHKLSEGYATYIVDMKTCVNWNGTVDRLRIDPFEVKSPSEDNPYYTELDYVKVCTAKTLILDENYDGAAKNEYTVPAEVKITLSDYAVPEREGYLFAGWSDGKSVVKSVALKSDTVLKAIWIKNDAPQFMVKDSASIRWKNPFGMRMLASINNDTRIEASLSEYGFLAARTSVLGNSELTFDFKADGYKTSLVKAAAYSKESGTDIIFGSNSDETILSAVVSGIPETYANENMTLRGYAVYSDGNGGTKAVYGNSVTLSLAEICHNIVSSANYPGVYTDEQRTVLEKFASMYSAS